MKFIPVVLVALAASVSVAHAGDFSKRYGSAEPAGVQSSDALSVAPKANKAVDWSGAYAGLTFGHSWVDVRPDELSVDGASADMGMYKFDTDSWMAGGTIGYSAMLNDYVLGVEADHSFLDASYGSADTAEFELKGLSTIRARAGYMLGESLPYVTGGLAFGHTKVRALGESDKQTHVGWTIGGGVERMLFSGVSGKIEYLYYDLGSEKYETDVSGVPVSIDGDLDGHIVRGGLNFRF